MAGHSHSANIKYRKDRQDQARSELFLKLRRKIVNLIQEEGQITEKVLSIARENKFPKEKIYQIWEQIRSEKEKKESSLALYQAPFGIIVFGEGEVLTIENLAKSDKWKKIPLHNLPNYFRSLYNLELEIMKESYDLEEYFLSCFPMEVIEKATEINYWEKTIALSFSEHKEVEIIKNIAEDKKLELQIKSLKTSRIPILPQFLTTEAQKEYYKVIKEKLIGCQFYTNIIEK